jgi:hypothetical protein
MCSDLGPGIEPGRGGTLSWESNALPQSYKVIPKKSKKKPLYFMGKNLSHATYWTPDWFRTSRNPTSDWLIQKKREK